MELLGEEPLAICKLIVMRIIITILSCCLLTACHPQKKDLSPIENLLSKNGYWKLAGGDSFKDGGSFCLTFLSESGEALHVFVLPDRQRNNGKLEFELRTNYNRKTSVKIHEGSELENCVVWLLDNYADRPEIQIPRTEVAKMKTALLHRTGEFPFMARPAEQPKSEHLQWMDPGEVKQVTIDQGYFPVSLGVSVFAAFWASFFSDSFSGSRTDANGSTVIFWVFLGPRIVRPLLSSVM